jgi:hypothetical protein
MAAITSERFCVVNMSGMMITPRPAKRLRPQLWESVAGLPLPLVCRTGMAGPHHRKTNLLSAETNLSACCQKEPTLRKAASWSLAQSRLQYVLNHRAWMLCNTGNVTYNTNLGCISCGLLISFHCPLGLRLQGSAELMVDSRVGRRKPEVGAHQKESEWVA